MGRTDLIPWITEIKTFLVAGHETTAYVFRPTASHCIPLILPPPLLLLPTTAQPSRGAYTSSPATPPSNPSSAPSSSSSPHPRPHPTPSSPTQRTRSPRSTRSTRCRTSTASCARACACARRSRTRCAWRRRTTSCRWRSRIRIAMGRCVMRCSESFLFHFIYPFLPVAVLCLSRLESLYPS